MTDGAFQDWVGRVEEAEDRVGLRPVRSLAATLDTDPARLAEGDPLPPLWHWLGYVPDAPMSELGTDGHPRRGGFLPPVPLERRMWAGGRLSFHERIRVGETLRRRSEILRVESKESARGRMVFVTVAHALTTDRGLAVSEEQDIVYVAMPGRFTPPPPVAPPEARAWEEAVAVDEARLFRFSAVTFNAHRIHYDLPYATGVEKYPGLVVHGPLQAILLMEAARRRRGGAWPAAYAFRGVRPVFHTDPLRLVAAPEADGGQALCTVAGEAVGMQAKVEWRDAG